MAARAELRSSFERDEAYGLVRRFSQRVGEEYPQNHLAQALACSEEYEQARESRHQRRGSLQALLTSAEPGASESAIDLLNAEMMRMKEAWAKLVRNTSGPDRTLLDRERVDFATVRDAIKIWGQKYEKKQEMEYSSAKVHFSRFCETMDSYSGLLSFIPDDDKYIKPFCGVLTTIVQASINRGKIANGFASALEDIGIEMTYWKDQLAAFHRERSVASSNGLVRIVVQLFTRIFRFLVPYLTWGQSGWERFKGSVNKNYYENNIQGPLEEVKKFSDYLKRETGVQNSRILVHTEELAEKGLTLGGCALAATEENSQRIKNIETMLARRETTDRASSLSEDGIRSLFEKIASMLCVGDYGQVMLIANSEEAAYRQRMGAVSNPLQRDSEIGTSDGVVEAGRPRASTHELTFTELDMRSRSLGAATTGCTGETLQSPQQTPAKIYIPLQEWLSASESRILWIYGPPNTNKPSDLSSTSAFIVTVITRAKLPLVAHQCQNSGFEIGALISMIYSVIIQLIWLLPDNFATDIDLSSDRFIMLDRSIGTLPDALLLMEDLLTLVPRLLVVVLDGLQLCEDGRDDEQGTGLFLNFFLAILKNSKEGRVLKVLFTTDGVCHNLWKKLDAQEQIDVMNEAGGSAGRRRIGRMAMAGLTIPEY